MPVTHEDIAERSRVSRAAVSQVLRDPEHPRFSPATRQRILDAARSLNYVPNRMAAGLREGRTRTLGLVMPFNVPELMDTIEQVANRSGYALLIQFTFQPNLADETRALHAAMERQVDGIIWQPTAPTGAYDPLVAQIHRGGTRVVLLERDLPQLPEAPLIRHDTEGGARAALTHLREQGYERLVYVTCEDDYLLRQRRAEQVMRLEEEVEILSMGGRDDDQAMLERLPAGRRRPMGIYCDTDWLAVKLLREAEGLGMPCPGQVGIVLLGDMLIGNQFRVGELTRPTLTAVRRHQDRAARACVERLVHDLQREEEPGPGSAGRDLAIEPTLIPRQSTARSG